MKSVVLGILLFGMGSPPAFAEIVPDGLINQLREFIYDFTADSEVLSSDEKRVLDEMSEALDQLSSLNTFIETNEEKFSPHVRRNLVRPTVSVTVALEEDLAWGFRTRDVNLNQSLGKLRKKAEKLQGMLAGGGERWIDCVEKMVSYLDRKRDLSEISLLSRFMQRDQRKDGVLSSEGTTQKDLTEINSLIRASERTRREHSYYRKQFPLLLILLDGLLELHQWTVPPTTLCIYNYELSRVVE